MEEPILALVDSSLYWKSVCDLAIWASKELNAPIRLLNVLDKMSEDAAIPADIAKDIDNRFYTDFLGGIHDDNASYARLMQELGQTVLDNAKAYIEKHTKNAVDTKLRYDSLDEAIRFYGKKSSLIVIGKQGQKTVNKSQQSEVGGNFETIIRASPKPVLAATINVGPIGKALLIYDDDFELDLAIRYIRQYPLFTNKTIYIAFSKYAFNAVSEDVDQIIKQLDEEGVQASALLLEDDRDGESINRIVDENEVDMIILSAFNKAKIKKLIFGSFHKTLIQKIKVPALIIGNPTD